MVRVSDSFSDFSVLLAKQGVEYRVFKRLPTSRYSAEIK